MTTDTRSLGRATSLVVCALALFIIIDLGFRWAGFDRVRRTLTAYAARRGARVRPIRDAKELGRETFEAVCTATRFYYRRRLDCLPKALATQCLLLARGVSAHLCLGVRLFPFAGHAWVEVDGERFDDSPSAKYRAGSYTLLERF
jgi:hypothetical protein